MLFPRRSSQRPCMQHSDSMAVRRQQWLIFYHASVEDIAFQLLKLMGAHAELSDLQWKRFSDGFPDLQINRQDAHRLEQFYGTCVIAGFHDPEIIFEQLCLLHELPRIRAKNLHVIVPWFSTGTKERVEKLGQIATAKSLADMLSSCPVGLGGPATMVMYDIHWLQEQFYFTDQVLTELLTAVPLCLTALASLESDFPDEKTAIVFPDEGAHKKMRSTFTDFDQIICDKVRDGDKRIVTFCTGKEFVEGRHCIIVDDMVMSGGLMLECAQQLHKLGAARISCFTVHAVLPKQAHKKFVGNSLIHKFWITDTVPTTAALVKNQAPFEILSIAPLIANYLGTILEDDISVD